MSPSYQKNPQSARVNVQALLEEAQIAVRESLDTQGGRLHELEPQCGSRRVLVFDGKNEGVTLAIRLEVPQENPLRNEPVTSSAALTFLGALTLALQGHQAEARLISGSGGLEAVLISRRLCDPRSLDQFLETLQAIAQQVEATLSATGRELVERVLDQVRPVAAALVKESLSTEPAIVPTFDEEARNRMMQQTNF